MKKNKWIRAIGATGVAALTAGSLAACGSGSASGSATGGDCDGGLPDQIKIVTVKDQTGVAAYTGTEAWKGIQLAAKEINAGDMLGDSELVVEVEDTAGDVQTAASHVTAAAADGDVSAVLGPVLSDQALAVAPIADRSEIPIVYTQAGSQGIVDEDWNFRATPPLVTYYDRVGEYLEQQGVKTVGTVFAADIPTLEELSNDVLVEVGAEHAFDVTEQVATQSTTQDYSGPVQKALSGDPDAVGMFMVGAQISAGLQQVSRAGYDGLVISYPNAAPAVAELGASAEGVTWPTNFDASVGTPEVKAFADAFQAEYDATATNYAAEGYDSLMWVAKAIEQQDCATRDAVKKGLEEVGKAGFTGTQGDLTFESNGHDARSAGYVVQWDGSKVVVLDE